MKMLQLTFQLQTELGKVEGKNVIKGDTRKVRNTRKICRNKGEEYITKSGKTVSKRKSTSLGWCRMKCQEKFEQYREELFKEYWAVGDGSKRASYIASLIELRNRKHIGQDIVMPIIGTIVR